MRSIWAMAALIAGTVSAGAQDSVPDFTGVWSGTFKVLVLGRDAGSEGKVDEIQITYELMKQDGRLLWGSVWSDPASKKPIALAFSLNNGTLVGSDPEGLHRFTVISTNRMESCFTDNGAEKAIIATCGLIG